MKMSKKTGGGKDVLDMPEQQHARSCLGALELLVMLGIVKLGNKAWGTEIVRIINSKTKIETHVGAVYTSLARLETKKFIRSTMSKSEPRRGGRARRYYEPTAKGKMMLSKSLVGIQKLAA
jgi:PadR family transcriptional regulator, regulatory protein PadR